MCLIAMAWGAHPQYALVLASNRDEFYNRPTAALAAWQTDAGQPVVGGRDIRDGGTWLGFSPSGRFACLTNVRPTELSGAADFPRARSRGELAVAWLESGLQADAWLSTLDMQAYAGFNLIVGDWQTRSCVYVSNKPTHTVVPIGWGSVVSLSNAALETPWPKTVQLKTVLVHCLAGQPSVTQLQQELMHALADTNRANSALVPQTGLGMEHETALSSAFVTYPPENPNYGTRCSTVAVLGSDGYLHLLEKTHIAPGQDAQTQHYSLSW